MYSSIGASPDSSNLFKHSTGQRPAGPLRWEILRINSKNPAPEWRNSKKALIEAHAFAYLELLEARCFAEPVARAPRIRSARECALRGAPGACFLKSKRPLPSQTATGASACFAPHLLRWFRRSETAVSTPTNTRNQAPELKFGLGEHLWA